MKFTCTVCTQTERHASFADANRFASWTHVGEALLCGKCYRKHIAAKTHEDDRPTPEDLVSNGDCPQCGSYGFVNPEHCDRCAEEWRSAAELAMEYHERLNHAGT